MLVSVSILTQTWVLCWFRFRFWLRLGYYVDFGFDFDQKECYMLNVDFHFDSDLYKMLVWVSILTQTWTKCWFRFWQKRLWYVECWFRFWLRLGQRVGFGFDSDWEKVLVLVSILTNNLVKCNMVILTSTQTWVNTLVSVSILTNKFFNVACWFESWLRHG